MKWVMVDLETTGLIPGWYEVIEVGLVDQDGKFDSFSLDFDANMAAIKALEVNRWYDEDRAQSRRLNPVQAYRLLCEWFDPWGATESNDIPEQEYPVYLVAWPTQFDVAFLTEWCDRHDVPTPWHYRNTIDVRSYASALYGPGVSLDSEACAKRWGMDVLAPEDKHSALGDAAWQAEAFRNMLKDRDDLIRLASSDGTSDGATPPFGMV